MNFNVGGTDKKLRIIFGTSILLTGIIFQSWWGLLGVIPLLTGLVNFCPLYCPLNIDTKNKKES